MKSVLSEKTLERYRPFLEPDERMFLAPVEGSTIRSVLTWIPFDNGDFFDTFVGRTRLIVVTDRAVLVLKGSKFRSRPKAVAERAPARHDSRTDHSAQFDAQGPGASRLRQVEVPP